MLPFDIRQNPFIKLVLMVSSLSSLSLISLLAVSCLSCRSANLFSILLFNLVSRLLIVLITSWSVNGLFLSVMASSASVFCGVSFVIDILLLVETGITLKLYC